MGWLLGLSKSIQFQGDRDLMVMGDCDETVQKMVDKAQWNAEMDQIESVTVTL